MCLAIPGRIVEVYEDVGLRMGRIDFAGSMLVSQVLVPPAITAVLQSPGNRVRGFLGPGHVRSAP